MEGSKSYYGKPVKTNKPGQSQGRLEQTEEDQSRQLKATGQLYIKIWKSGVRRAEGPRRSAQASVDYSLILEAQHDQGRFSHVDKATKKSRADSGR